MHMSISLHAYIYVCTYIYIHIYMYIYACIYIYIYIHIYVYTYLRVYIYIHLHIYYILCIIYTHISYSHSYMESNKIHSFTTQSANQIRCFKYILNIRPSIYSTIQVRLTLGGMPLILKDTAGLRAGAADDIEAEGIARALAAYHKVHI